VRVAAIAAVLVLGLATGAAVTAAQSPKRTTMTGKIKVLKVQTITVHGTRNLTCRIGTASPKPGLRGFTLGTRARITCARGVLLKIVRPVPGSVEPAGTVTNPKTATSPTEPAPEPTVTTPPTGGVKTAPSVAGTATITLLANGTIEFGNAISCQLGGNSPSVAGYRVGSRVSYTCTGGELTSIGVGEGA
jgi:hypothetical protein